MYISDDLQSEINSNNGLAAGISLNFDLYDAPPHTCCQLLHKIMDDDISYVVMLSADNWYFAISVH